MKQEYKDTFNQIKVSDELDQKLLDIPQEDGRKRRRPGIMKFAYAMLIVVLISIPTASVLAANGVDLMGVFEGIFGDKAGIIEESTSLPEVNVLSNTFEDIDIDITGITGDEDIVYVTMDISKKDGSAFTEEYQQFTASSFLLREFNGEKLIDGYSKGQGDLLFTSSEFRLIPNEDNEENRLSFAYIVNVKAVIDGKNYKIPGETFRLMFSNSNAEDDFGIGTWEAEFAANYKEAESITINVDKLAHMPKIGTDDDYNYEADMMVNNVKLSPFTLRYESEYDFIGNGSNEDWNQIYLEMDDGSIIGEKLYFETSEYHLADSKNIESYQMSEGEPWENNWIFDEPIDITKVKTINFGDLTIDVPSTMK